jgi:hypothetical protein
MTGKMIQSRTAAGQKQAELVQINFLPTGGYVIPLKLLETCEYIIISPLVLRINSSLEN